MDGVLRERDTAILLGDPKAGKSLLAQQLIFSMTSGEPFLGQFKVLRECNVLYIAVEGEVSDWQDRYLRMQTTLSFEPKRFMFKFSEPLALQTMEGLKRLMMDINMAYQDPLVLPQYEKIDLIILDPIYMGMIGGSLSDDNEVRSFLANIRILKDYYKAAILMLHHTHKSKHDSSGKLIIEDGDTKMFGSQMFLAAVDQLLYFSYDKKTQLRHLVCSSQRSGSIIKPQVLRLIEPVPLYFELTGDKPGGAEDVVLSVIKRSCRKVSRDEVQAETEVSDATFFRIINKAIAAGMVEKTDSRPVYYRYNHDFAAPVQN